jgi:hypothetical protein
MHAQGGCQLEDIYQREITFTSFDISRVTWMDVRQFRQFCQCHSALVAKLPDRLPKMIRWRSFLEVTQRFWTLSMHQPLGQNPKWVGVNADETG